MARDYKSELETEKRKLDALLIDVEIVQAYIAKQKRIVAALTELASIEEDAEAPTGLVAGITDAVRTVFMGAEKTLTPAEVRDRVTALGLPPQQNLLASVHTVIRRLLQSREIEAVGDGFKWKSATGKLAYPFRRKGLGALGILRGGEKK